MPWFGEPWPSPTLRAFDCEDDGDRVRTPAGRPCVLCEEPIAATDSGTLVAARDHVTDVWGPEPVHRECSLREVLGGAGHLATAPHQPGACNPDGGLTRRQSALLVQRWVDRMGAERILGAHRFKLVREQLQQDIEGVRLAAARE
jgi:hypothetical protein